MAPIFSVSRQSRMELLNIRFVILVVKISVCALPAVFAIYLLAMPDKDQRRLGNKLNMLFFEAHGVISHQSWKRARLVIAAVALIFTGVATWFLILAGLFES